MARTSSMFVIIKEVIGEMKLNKDETNFSEETLSEIPDRVITKLISNLNNLSDERHKAYVKYPVQEIIFISFFAVLANANNWIEIENFAKRKKEWAGLKSIAYEKKTIYKSNGEIAEEKRYYISCLNCLILRN